MNGMRSECFGLLRTVGILDIPLFLNRNRSSQDMVQTYCTSTHIGLNQTNKYSKYVTACHIKDMTYQQGSTKWGTLFASSLAELILDFPRPKACPKHRALRSHDLLFITTEMCITTRVIPKYLLSYPLKIIVIFRKFCQLAYNFLPD